MKRFYIFAVVLAVAATSAFAWFYQKNSQSHSVPDKEAVLKTIETMPRGFVPNQEQWHEEALFSAPGFFGNTWITKNGELRHVILAKEECKKEEKHKPCPTKAWVLSESFVGGNVKDVKGEKELFTKVSYLIGNDKSKHKAGLSSYEIVSFGEVWKGIEVKLKAKQNSVEKIFVVKPRANPEEIKISLKGAKGIEIKRSGELLVKTGYGDVEFSKPIAWQEEGRERKPVKVSYRLDKTNNTYAFAVEGYDKNKPLYIDPLLASTFLGGSSYDSADVIAIDSTGNVYVAGTTASKNFPTTPGSYDKIFNSRSDVFISKLDKDLTKLLASTYLGGSGNEVANAIAIDSLGNIYVAGYTNSTDFPTTQGAYQKKFNGGVYDVFISKLDSNLTKLLASTFLGGGSDDYAKALTVDSSGDVYVAGETDSKNFPIISGAYDRSFNGGQDVFVSKLDSNLTKLLASTYFGGSDIDYASALAIDSSGNIYVAGSTASKDFPTTSGSYDRGYNGDSDGFVSKSDLYLYDVFVSKLDKNLTKLLASTYLGGNDGDFADALVIDSSGNVYVAGGTSSKNFPTTKGVYNGNYNGGDDDAFISKLDSNLTKLLASTFLGGRGWDEARDIAIDSSGNIYVAGKTDSKNFPTTTGAYDRSFNGGQDVFVSKLDSNLTKLLASTYLGGGSDDEARAIAIDSSGNVYVAGGTSSKNFPTTKGVYNGNYNGGDGDAFISKFDANLSKGKQK